MKKILYFLSILVLFFSFSCESINEEILEEKDNISTDNVDDITNTDEKFKILSLGDSYTIGESVCEKCRFPDQLKDSLINNFDSNTSFDLKIIARTGWTTTNLINAINSENIPEDFDLVTLLIGVNNQYQNRPFSTYEKEFPELVATAIKSTKNIASNLIVVSIPDYAFTPFGNGSASISKDIDKYNSFVKDFCEQNNITFVNITEITRKGLINPDLVASDGLHPSELAYTKFVELILPLALRKLN